MLDVFQKSKLLLMKLMKTNKIIILIITTLLFCMCNNNQTPRPLGYYRIELPPHYYVKNDTIGPYIAEVSKYCTTMESDNKLATNDDEWINLYYPTFNATIHLSYKKINNNFSIITEESRQLVYEHTIRADAINESFYSNPENNTYCIYYELKGNAASPAQFYVTDSTNHFLRGALYFNNIPNSDSIAPVNVYIQQDIIHLIETLKWK